MASEGQINLVGVRLKNRYQITNLLGRGSIGEVYRARDILLKRDVAIKVLSQRSLGTSDSTRLLHEAQYIANLNHPNIVTVHDVGNHGDRPFVVMEFVEGQTLHEARPEEFDTILSIAVDICKALQHAHAQGIIHRDIKPENIILDHQGRARLMDFGIAMSAASRLTVEGALVGTVFYIAPEQALGKDIDPRADLYSLGIILYELITGELPFTADDPLAVISQHIHAPVVPPRAKNDRISPALEAVILSLMEKDPGDRPSSAEQVRSRLSAPEILDLDALPAKELSMLDRIVQGRMVGREQELQQAGRIWDQAVEGQGQLLLVSGEPGVGKTRLMHEIVTMAEISGGLILTGRNYAEGYPPYTPFRQILHESIRFSKAYGLEIPENVITGLLKVAPELQAEFPDPPDRDITDDQTEGQRLSDQILYLFTMISNIKPVLLVMEDAHWCDSSTLILLRSLVRSMRAQRFLLLITYREVALDEARALHEILLDFNREKLGLRIKLNRLNRQETHDMLAILFDEEISSAFLDGIYLETEGNPFFIEEVCKAIVENGKLTFENEHWKWPSMEEIGIPQSIQVAIQSRLRRLPEDTQRMLEQAAILGREFDFQTLSQALNMEEDGLLNAIDEALYTKLIAETGKDKGGKFQFNHALIPATIVASLRIFQRRRLHKNAASALEVLHPEAFEALAYHNIEAGEAGKGVNYLIKAGDRAGELFAHQEAIHSYQQALDYLKEEGELVRAARTLMKLGLVYHNIFQFPEARQAYEQGLSLWQQTGQLVKNETLSPAPHALRGLMREPTSLDPGLNYDGFSDPIIHNIFCGLVELNSHQEVVPDVARRWELLDHGRRYVFYLREDAIWSDGAPVSAHDFEFAWKRALDPASGSFVASELYAVKNAKAFHQGESKKPETVGVRARDALTLEVELEQPSNAFLYIMSKAVSFPVPRHVVQKYGANWTNPDVLVTNGPFRLAEWKQGENILLEANSNYPGGFTGNLRQVKMHFYKNQQPGWGLELYQDDRIDFLWLSDIAEPRRARYQYPEAFRSAPMLGTHYIGFNTKLPPFDNVRVRRAFALATDREQLINELFGGLVFAATGGMLPPGMPGYEDGIALPYDPEKARSLLAEVGYPNGLNFPETEFLCPPHRSAIYQDILQSQWLENLGIKIKWNVMPWESFLERDVLHIPHLFAVGTFVTHPDPHELLRESLVGIKTGWSNQEYQALIQRASETQDFGERVKMYQRADRILADEVPILPTGYFRFNLLVKPWVRRFPLSPVRGWYWKEVILELH